MIQLEIQIGLLKCHLAVVPSGDPPRMFTLDVVVLGKAPSTSHLFGRFLLLVYVGSEGGFRLRGWSGL